MKTKTGQKLQSQAERIAKRLLRDFAGRICRYESYEKVGNAWEDVRTIPVVESGTNENGEMEYDNDTASYGDFHDIPSKHLAAEIVRYGIDSIYLLPNYMSGSDYSGGTVERSNCRVFLAEFGGVPYSDNYVGNVDGNAEIPGVHRVYGGHGTFAVALSLSTYLRYPDIRECLDKLDDYPLIDDEDMSRLEMHAADEDWNNWTRKEFTDSLEKKFNIAEWNDEDIRQFFEECAEAANEYWHNECGGDMYIDVERIVKVIEDVDYVPQYSNSGKCLRDFVASFEEESD